MQIGSRKSPRPKHAATTNNNALRRNQPQDVPQSARGMCGSCVQSGRAGRRLADRMRPPALKISIHQFRVGRMDPTTTTSTDDHYYIRISLLPMSSMSSCSVCVLCVVDGWDRFWYSFCFAQQQRQSIWAHALHHR